jgi:hypothetical protein
MRSKGWLVAPVGLMLVLTVFLLVPAASASIVGTGTLCKGFGTCVFSITDSKGTGWAKTYETSISFLLPGESKATTNIPYSYYPHPIYGGTYTIYGSFVGTDANTEKVILGTTVTNITVTVHCQRGCYDTWVLNSGTITFHPTNADPTTISFSCSPGSINSGGKTVCQVTVTDQANASRIPTGTVKFSTQYSGVGTWSPAAKCTLSSASCKVTFTAADETVGTVTMYAHYVGSSAFYQSTGITYVYVTSPP